MRAETGRAPDQEGQGRREDHQGSGIGSIVNATGDILADDGRLPIRGMDGKRYRRGPLTPDERAWLVMLAHLYRCARGNSIRESQRLIAAEGYQVSLGALSRYLREWTCHECSGAANAAPEQQDHLCSGARNMPPEQVAAESVGGAR